MNEGRQEDFQYIISLSDILGMLRKGMSRIIAGSLCAAILLAFFSLLRPVTYQAEATFKEKGNSDAGLSGTSLASLFLSSLSGGESQAKSLMLSRKILSRVVQDLNLQGAISKQAKTYPLLGNISDNLITEFFYLRKKQGHPLPELQPELKLDGMTFSGEVPISLLIAFDTEDTFQVIGAQNETLGIGRLNQPFATADYTFTLKRLKTEPLASTAFVLTLLPLRDVTESLKHSIKIEPDKEDPTVLVLKYSHRDRLLACRVINQLMHTYHDYLEEEQDRLALEQISYLHKREMEMGKTLKEKIEAYADMVASEVSQFGYTNTEKGIDFLAHLVQEQRKKILDIDLELKRYHRLEQGETPFEARYLSDANPQVINQLIAEIRALRQQSDGFELALRNSSRTNVEKWKLTFHEQVSSLKETRESADEVKLLLAHLSGNRPLPSVKLLDHPKYMLREWIGQLEDSKASNPAATNENPEHLKEQFIAYLANLNHFLDVKEKTIQERLSHQQAPQFDFQGIDLNTAKELYISYSKQLSDLEAQILHLQFVSKQLHDPSFEISSIGTVIANDPVIRAVVDKSSANLLALQDDSNRGPREKERLKQELLTQKRFLDLHMKQTIDLLELKSDLVKDKIQSLQNASLELIQQQTSILEKQLVNSLEAHIDNLTQQRQLYEQNQLLLRGEMALLPQKWAAEKLIEQQLKMNSAMVEEISKLVESKNIAKNLEMVQSAPIDPAIPSVFPARPKIILFSTLGAFLGAFLSLAAVILSTLKNGIPVSKENLQLAGVSVIGQLNGLQGDNLETLRKLSAALRPPEGKGKSLALIKGNLDNLPGELAALLSKKGDRILLLDLCFTASDGNEGLLQYLEGECPILPVVESDSFDKVPCGGMSIYRHELLNSKNFRELLENLKAKYDWVIGFTDCLPGSAEGELLVGTFDCSLITAAEETLDTISPLIVLTHKLKEEKEIFYAVAAPQQA